MQILNSALILTKYYPGCICLILLHGPEIMQVKQELYLCIAKLKML
jgi:hypothetical protein